MTTFLVEFAPEVADQLEEIEIYITEQGSPETGISYVDAIVSYCESLQSFPLRGTARDDIRPGLRITHFKGRAIIAFAVRNETVYILGVFYGGRDYESILLETARH